MSSTRALTAAGLALSWHCRPVAPVLSSAEPALAQVQPRTVEAPVALSTTNLLNSRRRKSYTKRSHWLARFTLILQVITAYFISGEAPTESLKLGVTNLVNNIPKVRQVYNEMALAARAPCFRAPTTLIFRQGENSVAR